MFNSSRIFLLLPVDVMASSDSYTVLQSSALVAPVTALEFLEHDCLLSGELHAGVDWV